MLHKDASAPVPLQVPELSGGSQATAEEDNGQEACGNHICPAEVCPASGCYGGLFMWLMWHIVELLLGGLLAARTCASCDTASETLTRSSGCMDLKSHGSTAVEHRNRRGEVSKEGIQLRQGTKPITSASPLRISSFLLICCSGNSADGSGRPARFSHPAICS